MVWKDKIPIAAASRRRRRPELTRYMENSQPQGKRKEIYAEIDAVGSTERENEYVEQML